MRYKGLTNIRLEIWIFCVQEVGDVRHNKALDLQILLIFQCLQHVLHCIRVPH